MMIELVFTSLFVGLTSAVTDINAEARATRKKVKVFILAGQSNMEGHGQIQSLDHLGNHPQYGHLLKKLKALDGSWAVSNNVFVSWQTYGQPRRHAPLSVGQGAHGKDRGARPDWHGQGGFAHSWNNVTKLRRMRASVWGSRPTRT